jgi:hypothetical protein
MSYRSAIAQQIAPCSNQAKPAFFAAADARHTRTLLSPLTPKDAYEDAHAQRIIECDKEKAITMKPIKTFGGPAGFEMPDLLSAGHDERSGHQRLSRSRRALIDF